MNNGIIGGAVGGANSSGAPVGSAQWFPPSSSTIRLVDGSEWLRTGVLADKSIYPALHKIETFRAHVFTKSLSASGINVSSIANNGAGVYIVAFTSTSQVLRSTDYGKTWSTINIASGGGVITRVIFANGVFQAHGNDTTAIYGTRSTTSDGSAWSTATVVTGLTGLTSSTVKFCWTGSYYVLVCQATSNCCYTSTNGTTWTARTTAGSWDTRAIYLSGGNNRALILYLNRPTTQASVFTSETTNITTTIPVATGSSMGGDNYPQPTMYVPSIGQHVCMFASGNTYYLTPDFVTFTGPFSIPTSSGLAILSYPQMYEPVSERWVFGTNTNSIVYTKDFVSWGVQSLNATTAAANGLSQQSGVSMDSSSIVCVPSFDTILYANSSIDNTSYVGSATPIYSNPVTPSQSGHLYIRAK